MARKRRPGKKASLAKDIEQLPVVREVDVMLMEGTGPRDVALWLQEEEGLLTEAKLDTLVTALHERRFNLMEEKAEEAAYADILVDEDEDHPVKISTLSRNLYKKTIKGVQEHIELEALYLAQRRRLDNFIAYEVKNHIQIKDLSGEILAAANLLTQMAKIKKDIGVLGHGSSDITHDFEGLSKETAEVLGKPESRRRVISIVDRLSKVGKLKFDPNDPANDDDDEGESAAAG